MSGISGLSNSILPPPSSLYSLRPDQRVVSYCSAVLFPGPDSNAPQIFLPVHLIIKYFIVECNAFHHNSLNQKHLKSHCNESGNK